MTKQVWYSRLQPTRPIQLTFQNADFRVPFWDFPHPSVSTNSTTVAVSRLYDAVIAQFASAPGAPPASHVTNYKTALIATVSALGALLLLSWLVVGVVAWRRAKTSGLGRALL